MAGIVAAEADGNGPARRGAAGQGLIEDESGSATVESVIWLVAFFMLLMMVADASLAFYGKAQAFRILQDGNRAYSVGRLDTVDETADWIEAAIEPLAPNAVATTTVASGVVSSELSIPISDLTMFDAFGSFDMTVRTQHYVE